MTVLQDLLERGDRKGVTTESAKILARKPTDGEALSSLARLALEKGDLEEAKTHLLRVGPRERKLYEVLLAEALILLLSGQFDAARLAFAELTATHPTRPEAFGALGLSLLETPHVADAESALATAVSLRPKNFHYRFNHAHALALNGRLAEAVQALTSTIELRPDFVSAYLSFARMLESSGMAEQGLKILGAGLKLMPHDRYLQAEQLRIRIASGDTSAFENVDLSLVDELLEAGAHDTVLAVCTELEARGKGSGQVSLLKGLAYENASRTGEALDAYSAAMAQDSHQWEAANNRGLLLLKEFQEDAAKLAEAKATLEDAVKRAAGKAAAPLLNLALLYGHQREYVKGIAVAKKVIAHPDAGELKEQAQKMVASMEKASKSK
jgi:Flp pilus assembly protein TadD